MGTVGMLALWPGDEPIGLLVGRVRSECGKSQYALAHLLAEASGRSSVTREFVSRWENGKRIPTPYWREHLGAVLGIPRDVLDRAVAVAQARRAAAKAAADHKTSAERTLGCEGPPTAAAQRRHRTKKPRTKRALT
jgi:transcriptional regulator with XRE-family HTH domain